MIERKMVEITEARLVLRQTVNRGAGTGGRFVGWDDVPGIMENGRPLCEMHVHRMSITIHPFHQERPMTALDVMETIMFGSIGVLVVGRDPDWRIVWPLAGLDWSWSPGGLSTARVPAPFRLDRDVRSLVVLWSTRDARTDIPDPTVPLTVALEGTAKKELGFVELPPQDAGVGKVK